MRVPGRALATPRGFCSSQDVEMRRHAPRPETSARRISPCVGLRWARCAARTRRCRLAATASRCRRLGRLCTSPLHLGRSRLISADLGQVSRLDWLRTLCAGYPSVKFLVTVLSAVNQHELCVLARKFGNLHVYGCWWFCNNPSIIETTTRMRLEMLGTAFTCQHSDARARDSSSTPALRPLPHAAGYCARRCSISSCTSGRTRARR